MRNKDIKFTPQHSIIWNTEEKLMATEVISILKDKVRKMYIVWIVTLITLIVTNLIWILNIIL